MLVKDIASGTLINPAGFAQSSLYHIGTSYGSYKTDEQIAAIDKKITDNIDGINDFKTGANVGTKVYFEHSKHIRSVHLSDESLDKLQNFFSSKDFATASSGGVILSGDAERFVSGWFDDITTARHFVAKEQLDENDLKNVRNYSKIWLDGERVSKMQTYQANPNPESKSIDQELNHTIKLDDNLDGRVTLKELIEHNINIGKAELVDEISNPDVQSANNFAAGAFALGDRLHKAINAALDEIDFGVHGLHEQDLKRMLAQLKLQQIKQRIEQSGATSLSAEDKKALEQLQITPQSLEKSSEQESEMKQDQATNLSNAPFNANKAEASDNLAQLSHQAAFSQSLHLNIEHLEQSASDLGALASSLISDFSTVRLLDMYA